MNSMAESARLGYPRSRQMLEKSAINTQPNITFVLRLDDLDLLEFCMRPKLLAKRVATCNQQGDQSVNQT